MKSYKFCVTAIGACLALAASAQPQNFGSSESSGVYLKVYGAYGFFAPGSFKGRPELTNIEPIRFHTVKGGLGMGIRAGVGFGFVLNKYLNIGVDVEYLKGKDLRISENIDSAESRAYQGSGYSLEGERTYGHEVVSIIPNIVFKAVSKSTYNIYSRIGIVVGVPLKMTERYFVHYHYTNAFAGDHTPEDGDMVTTYNGKYTLKPSIGFQLSLGTQISISEKLGIFFEVSAYNISYDRKKYEDIERLRIQTNKNKLEEKQPTIYDHSKFVYHYINSGVTGTNIRGVPYNYLTTVRYAQEPVIMNAIAVGAGLAYKF